MGEKRASPMKSRNNHLVVIREDVRFDFCDDHVGDEWHSQDLHPAVDGDDDLVDDGHPHHVGAEDVSGKKIRCSFEDDKESDKPKADGVRIMPSWYSDSITPILYSAMYARWYVITINKIIRARCIFIDINQRYPTSIGSTSDDEYRKHPKSMDIYDPMNMQVWQSL